MRTGAGVALEAEPHEHGRGEEGPGGGHVEGGERGLAHAHPAHRGGADQGHYHDGGPKVRTNCIYAIRLLFKVMNF